MDQFKICRICGDKANCFNFSGLPSCPACRIFFQRHSTKYDKQKCLKQGKCEIDFVTRKSCLKCRLDKCFEIGMVLKSREEKKKEKFIKLQNEYDTQTDSDTTDIIDDDNETIQSVIVTNQIESILESNIRENISICSDDEVDKDNKNKRRKLRSKKKQQIPRSNQRLKSSLKLNKIETQQIETIENAFKVFEEENQLPVVGEDNIINFLSNLSTVYSRRAVKFCKKIPIFSSLSQEEQLVLLKPFCFDALFIRNAFHFNKDKIEFYALKDESGKEAILIKVNMFFLPQSVHLNEQNTQILARLHEAMENDARIRNMLSALVLVKPFTDNQNCSENVRYHYFVYRHLLRRYLEEKYGNSQAADRKFSHLMNMIENDFQIVKDNCRSMLIDHGVDLVADLVAEVLSIKD